MSPLNLGLWASSLGSADSGGFPGPSPEPPSYVSPWVLVLLQNLPLMCPRGSWSFSRTTLLRVPAGAGPSPEPPSYVSPWVLVLLQNHPLTCPRGCCVGIVHRSWILRLVPSPLLRFPSTNPLPQKDLSILRKIHISFMLGLSKHNMDGQFITANTLKNE